jgi:cytochrome c-type biogenesis protein CcmH/NrfG
LTTGQSLAAARRALELAKSSTSFNSQNILNAKAEVQVYRETLDELNSLYAELFGTPEENNPAVAPVKKTRKSPTKKVVAPAIV